MFKLTSSLIVICAFTLIVTTMAEETGEYVPKSVYMVDENGKAHDVLYINNFQRFKRQGQAYSGSFSSSSSSGLNPDALQGAFYDLANGNIGPQLFSRFGEGIGPGVSVGGTASGPNGAFSVSHSQSNNGRYSYSHKAGQF